MVIKGAMICDALLEQRGDIKIEGDRIVKVERSIMPSVGEEVFNADGFTLLPSAIDLNTRLHNDTLTKENILKLSQKAVIGGVGMLALMPDCKPSLSTELSVELLSTLQNELSAKIIGVTSNTTDEGSGIPPISSLYKKGVRGIFSKSSINGNLLRRSCEFATMLDLPMFFDCDDETLSKNGVMNDGELSATLGLSGILSLSEIKEVAMMCEVASFMGIRAIFNAISSDRSIEILKEAKKKNPNIFIQTSIHHLILTEDLCNNYNTAAKIRPPLKSESTRTKLIKRIKKLEIDLLTSLQSSQSLSKKDLAFDEAAFGVDMIDYFIPMCYSLLVKNERMRFSDLSRILSFNPAQALKLDDVGLIKEGYLANFCLLDTKETQMIGGKDSPYYDWIFSGKVKHHFIDGKQIF